MPLIMSAPPSTGCRALITPLLRDDLLDPGIVFPREELTRRILSLFWRDCCRPACFSRAPAPVVQLSAESDQPARRLRAWWLLDETINAIVEEIEGPYSERLRPFFDEDLPADQMWPRYEFRILPEPFTVEMGFHREPLSRQEHRTRLILEADGRVRVFRHEKDWCRPSTN